MLTYKEALKKINYKSLNFIFAPTSLYLSLFKDSNINLCIQDIALNEDLNLTGDISLNQIKSLDVKYAIIGHYERRKYYKETDNIKYQYICLKYFDNKSIEEMQSKLGLNKKEQRNMQTVILQHIFLCAVKQKLLRYE